MINCNKRQKEVKGDEEQYRCVEKKVPDTYLQIVDEPTCQGCPIFAMQNKPKCADKQSWTKDLISVKTVARDVDLSVVNTAEQDLGYEKPCAYRWDGVCRVTNHQINPEICKACDQETANVMATLPKKVANYANAIRQWIRKGRPVRTDEEVAERLEICMGNEEKGIPRCNLYDEESHGCKKCGCAVSTDKAPLGNKLRMKTEICPMGLWK